MVFFGEVGLSGAVRPVPHANLRLKEAKKLGFSRAVAPLGPNDKGGSDSLSTRPIRHIGEAIADIAAMSRTGPAREPVRSPSRRVDA
jgi:DNA repair protein RadA/Sms